MWVAGLADCPPTLSWMSHSRSRVSWATCVGLACDSPSTVAPRWRPPLSQRLVSRFVRSFVCTVLPTARLWTDLGNHSGGTVGSMETWPPAIRLPKGKPITGGSFLKLLTLLEVFQSDLGIRGL